MHNFPETGTARKSNRRTMVYPLPDRRARIRIGDREPRRPLVDYLATRFTYHDRTRWQEHVRMGRLLVNRRTATETSVLGPGDLVEFRMPDAPEPPVDTGYGVLFQDDALLVVDKPADLPCHPGGRYYRNTLWGLLRQSHGPHVYLALMNRIDRETAGLVLAARTRWAARELGRQFQRHTVFKRYVALVEGRFPTGTMEVCGVLAPDTKSAVRKRRLFRPDPVPEALAGEAKACRTTLTGILQSGEISCVEAVPHTGRLHQIRATLSGLGYPIVGDKIYGVDEVCFLRFIQGHLSPEDRRRLRLPRQALHAAELHIRHPATGNALRFRSELPADMLALINRCEKAGISP
jgi:RluA family pseudouridine synthase